MSSSLRLERLQSQVRTLEAEERHFQGQVASLLESKVRWVVRGNRRAGLHVHLLQGAESGRCPADLRLSSHHLGVL